MGTQSRSSPETGEGITLIGLGVNLGLMGLKLGLGVVSGSTALVADGIHSLSDLATDLMVLGGLRIARRPVDQNHPYGHGKFETLAGTAVALALVGVGIFIVWEAAALRRGPLSLSWAVALAAALSIALKEWLYRATMRVATKSGSSSIAANAWHHRSDALSSIPVLFGGVFAGFGIPQADSVAAMVVALFIGWAALRILRQTVHELTEGALSPPDQAKVVAAIEGVEGVRSWHELRTRHVGQDAFVDVHIQVDPSLTVEESHRIATKVEEAVRTALNGRASVTVHVEPKGEASEEK